MMTLDVSESATACTLYTTALGELGETQDDVIVVPNALKSVTERSIIDNVGSVGQMLRDSYVTSIGLRSGPLSSATTTTTDDHQLKT